MAKITTNLTFEIKKILFFILKIICEIIKKKKKNSPMDFEQCLSKSGV